MANAGGMYYPNLTGAFVREFPAITASVAGTNHAVTVTYHGERFEIIGDPHNEGAYAFDVLALGPATQPPVKRTARKAPSLATMERWVSNGVAKATDGCHVEPDGTCPHGCESWLLKLGLI